MTLPFERCRTSLRHRGGAARAVILYERGPRNSPRNEITEFSAKRLQPIPATPAKPIGRSQATAPSRQVEG